ncbi:MAG TPA: hypothetical protein DCE41_19905, partial [Cytophagales bacterium]|nr:hypothetical protein [Cytophagales bacterium]
TAIALLTPENGTTLDATQPIPFSWTASTDEETLTYLLQIQGFGTDTVVSTSETSLDYDGIGLQDDSTYTWQVTVTDGVDSLTTDSRTFVAINTVTGLFDWPKAPTWDMYPNPASNAIRLEGLEMSAQSIQILNATGQIVVDVQRVANMDPIFVEHLPEGIYQVVMVGTETISSRTLLIRR